MLGDEMDFKLTQNYSQSLEDTFFKAVPNEVVLVPSRGSQKNINPNLHYFIYYSILHLSLCFLLRRGYVSAFIISAQSLRTSHLGTVRLENGKWWHWRLKYSWWFHT